MITLSIDSIAAGGDGVGRHPDGRVVFVPRTSPGDVAEVAEVELRPRFVRGQLVTVKEPGSGRVAPECVHYVRDGCGGCQLQHLTAQAQREAKRRIVGDALRRIGRINVEDPELIASPVEWRYRTKISLAVRRSEAGPVVGLHHYAEPNHVFRLEDCLITRDRVMGLWTAVRSHLHLLPQLLLSVVLKEDRDGGLHLIVSVDKGTTQPWDATPLADAVGDATVSYWWRPWAGAARVVAGPKTGFPATAFEQVNPELAAVVRQQAVDSLGDVKGAVVWDLYGGVGDTATLLALRGAEVWSVDSDRAATRWARQRTHARLRLITDRVEMVLGRLPLPTRVIVNPPRAGLAASVTAWLEGWAGRQPGARLVYVSCDPATLARDLARMPSFRLQRVTAFDLFPQTSHVEALAVMEPSS